MQSILPLKPLRDVYKRQEKDTILVYFGDHLPTLGVNYAAYVQSGYFSDPLTSEDILKRQRTPFLIYANFELGESSIVHEGKDNELSSYNLMNAASPVSYTHLDVYKRQLPQSIGTVSAGIAVSHPK